MKSQDSETVFLADSGKTVRRFSPWFVVLVSALAVPIALGYAPVIFLGLAGVLLLPLFFSSLPNGIVLLPLFLYMPITISELIGLQLSEIGVAMLFVLWVGTLLTEPRMEAEASPAMVPIAFFFLACFLSLLHAKDVMAGFKNIIRLAEGFVFVFFIFVRYVRDLETFERALWAVVVGGVLASLYGINQFIIGAEETMGIERRIFGLLGGGYGAFIGSSIVCALCLLSSETSGTRKTVLFVFLAVLVAALALHQTRAWMGGTVAALVFVLSFLGNRKSAFKTVLVTALIIGVVVVLLQTRIFGLAPAGVTQLASENTVQMGLSADQNKGKYLSGLARLFLWAKGFGLFLGTPLFGLGIGNLRFRNMLTGELGSPSDEDSGYIDNQYLNILYETGIVGFIAWAVLLVVVFRAGKYLLKHTDDPRWRTVSLAALGSLVVFLTGGFFWNLTSTHEMIVMLAFWMAMVFAIGNALRNRSRSDVPLSGGSAAHG